jgi:hypothetical protein
MRAAVGKPYTARQDPTAAGTSKLAAILETGATNIRDPSKSRNVAGGTPLIVRNPAPEWWDPTTTVLAVTQETVGIPQMHKFFEEIYKQIFKTGKIFTHCIFGFLV